MNRPLAPALAIAFAIISVPVTHALARSLVPVPLECSSPLFDGIKRFNEELSGVKCFATSPTTQQCYIVADEKKGLQQIDIITQGKTTTCQPGPVLATKRGLTCLKGKKTERDFEAIASDGKSLFITGSWGNRRKKGVVKSPERWALIKQKLAASGGITGKCQAVKRKRLKTILRASLPQIYPFADVPLQCGGINIEGLAYLEGKLFFGLRSPSDVPTTGVWIFDLPARALFEKTKATLKAHRHHLHLTIKGKVQSGLGIRAMERLGKHQILLIAGPAGVNRQKLSKKGKQRIASICPPNRQPFYNNSKKPVGFSLWLWTPKTGFIKHLGDIGGPYKNRKLEGISVLSQKGAKLQLLLTFDGIDNAKMTPLATLSVSVR